MLPLRLALRLLRHRPGALLAFILLYGCGLSLYLVTDALIADSRVELRSRSVELLEGELRILSHRPYTPAEERALDSLIPAGARRAEVWGFLSMIRAGAATRLVQVKAMSPEYPLVGGFRFQGNPSATHPRPGEIFLPPELAQASGTGPGGTARLGTVDFKVAALYRDAPGGRIQFFNLGPEVFIPLSDLPRTGLDAKGSRIFRYRFYTFPRPPSAAELKALKRRLEAVLTDPEIEITVHTSGEDELSRSLGSATAFLAMVSLSAFLLSALGGGYFFHHHLVAERANIALFRTLGLRGRRLLSVYLLQNVILSLAAFAVALAAAQALLAFLPWLVERLFALRIPPRLPWSSLAKGAAYAVATSLLFCQAGFWWVRRLPPALLFKPVESGSLGAGGKAALYALMAAYFYALAWWDSRSTTLSGLFTGSALACFLCLAGGGLLLHRWLAGLRALGGFRARMALGAWRWKREQSLMAFAVLGFVAFTCCLLPQLQNLLVDEIRAPKRLSPPRFFLFDIQEEQYPALRDTLKAMGLDLADAAPMVRARLERINGRAFRKDSAEARGEEAKARSRMRNRGFNLSYRERPGPDEEVVAGRWWTGPVGNGGVTGDTAAGAVSLERDFAKRLGARLGDTLDFDVQGVPVRGYVRNLRRVRWTGFRPNFFALFQPGVLEGAPKTYIGTLRDLGGRPPPEVQARLVAGFPNVTMVDVADAVARAVSLLRRLQWLIDTLAGFGLLIGLAILALIVHGLVEDAQDGILLLRALGARSRLVSGLFLRQYLGFCLLAGMGGYALSVGAAWIIDAAVWGLPFRWDWRYGAACAAGSALAGCACALYAVRRHGRKRLRSLLAARG